MKILLIFVVFLFAFFLRSFLHFRYKWVGRDTFGHLLRALKIKETGSPFKGRKYSLGDKKVYLYYPPLMDFLLSFFPRKSHKKIKFFPVFFDLLTMFLLFLFSYFFLNIKNIFPLLLIYSISPILILTVQTITPRSFSNFLYCLSMIFLFLYFNTGFYYFLLFFSVFSSFLLISHKLTTQSLIISVFIISLISFDFLPIVFVLVSFLLAYLFTKGKYVYVFKSHMNTLKHHFKKGHYKKGTKSPENPILLFFSFPFVLVPILNIIFNGFSTHLLFFQIWFFTLLLTSFFWIWGDGYRYLTNAVFPGAIISIFFYKNLPFSNYIFLFCFISSLVGIFYIYYNFSKSDRVVDKDFLKACEYINKKSKKTDTLAVTMPSYRRTAAAYFCKLNTFPNKENSIKFKNKYATWLITQKTKEFKKNEKYVLKKSGKYSIFKLKNN